MNTLKVLAVVGLGFVDVAYGVPLGYALGLNAVVIGVAASVGSILSALATLLVGERVREWALWHNLRVRLLTGFRRDVKPKAPFSERHPRTFRVWERWGVVGLGIVAPVFIGAIPGVAIGVALGARKGPLLFWTSVGVVITGTLVTLALGGILHFAGLRDL